MNEYTWQLFDFVNLTGFSLMFRRGFYEMHMDMFLDGALLLRIADDLRPSSFPSEDNPTSQQLWDMLIQRCPNLEELTIDGVSPMPTDAHLLVEGRWPKLRKLTLGDVSIDWLHGPVDPTQKRPFVTWLEAHPNLESLNLSRHTIQSVHLSDLDSSCFQLSSFSGTIQQLQALPHIHSSLKSVSFREPLLTRDTSPQTVASLLQGMTHLTELKISFILHSMYDSGSLLRSLIVSSPHLQHLDLTCSNKPSFQLVRASSYLSLLFTYHLYFTGRLFQDNPRIHKAPQPPSNHRQIPRRRIALIWCNPYCQEQPTLIPVLSHLHLSDLPAPAPLRHPFLRTAPTIHQSRLRFLQTRYRPPRITTQPH
jgi:hypothetical protein